MSKQLMQELPDLKNIFSSLGSLLDKKVIKTRTDDAVNDILEIKKEPLISPEIEEDPSSQKVEVKSQAWNKI